MTNKKQSEILRNVINLIQTLTFRLNLNEWFKYERCKPLQQPSFPLHQNKIFWNPHPPRNDFLKFYSPPPPPPPKLGGVHAMLLVPYPSNFLYLYPYSPLHPQIFFLCWLKLFLNLVARSKGNFKFFGDHLFWVDLISFLGDGRVAYFLP